MHWGELQLCGGGPKGGGTSPSNSALAASFVNKNSKLIRIISQPSNPSVQAHGSFFTQLHARSMQVDRSVLHRDSND
jgi:hypothetical protein